MPYNPYTPYPQPAYMQTGFQLPNQNPLGSFQQQQPAPSVGQQPVFAFVNGVDAAKSYQMAPNQTAVLMDTENSAFYIKTANAIGQASMQYFKAVQSTEEDIRGTKAKQPDPTYATKDDLNSIIQRIEGLEKATLAKKEEAK